MKKVVRKNNCTLIYVSSEEELINVTVTFSKLGAKIFVNNTALSLILTDKINTKSSIKEVNVIVSNKYTPTSNKKAVYVILKKEL
jgi:hypothetical protein